MKLIHMYNVTYNMNDHDMYSYNTLHIGVALEKTHAKIT